MKFKLQHNYFYFGHIINNRYQLHLNEMDIKVKPFFIDLCVYYKEINTSTNNLVGI